MPIANDKPDFVTTVAVAEFAPVLQVITENFGLEVKIKHYRKA